jgi:hypothetical protein
VATKKNGKNLPARATKTETLTVTQAALPAFMRGKAGQGVEQIRSADVEIPRIQLLQALSPQVQEGFRQGEFFHTVAEESIGNEVDLVIVYVSLSYILWKPRKSGGGILARAQDGIHWIPANQEFKVNLDDGKAVTWRTADTVARSGLAEWGTMNPQDAASPPAATRMYNLVVMIPDHPELSPAVVTLQRSAVRVARKLMGKLKISQAPAYGLRFKMSSVKDHNNVNQEFWNYRFNADGLVEDQKMFAVYEAMYERFKAEGVRIRDEEGLQSDNIPDSGPQQAPTEEQTKKFAGKI